MKATYPVVFEQRGQRDTVARWARVVTLPIRSAGWVVGAVVGAAIAGLMQAWEDIR